MSKINPTQAYQITIKGFLVYQPTTDQKWDTVHHQEVEELLRLMISTEAYPEVDIVELIPVGDER